MFSASVYYAYGFAGPGLLAAYSTDSGATWTRRIMATGSDSLPSAFADPRATFDQFGNLFLTYGAQRQLQIGTTTGMNGASTLNDTTRTWAENMWMGWEVQILTGAGAGQVKTIASNMADHLTINGTWDAGKTPQAGDAYRIMAPSVSIVVVRSVNGGQSFTFMATLDTGMVADDGFIDRPFIATGPGTTSAGSVWVTWSDQVGRMSLRGAPVTGLNVVGAFAAAQQLPDSQAGNFGSVAIGPSGQVLVTYIDTASQPAANVYSTLDPDGLGPLAFLPRRPLITTNVFGLTIPAQPKRPFEAEPTLAWDRSGLIQPGFHGRVYLVYTNSPEIGSANTDIYVRYSNDSGATWLGDQVVHSANAMSQFLPAIAIDQTTGYVAVNWYDARNDDPANIRVDLYGTISINGGSNRSHGGIA